MIIYIALVVFVHVVLVFAIGALRNLNHMYAAERSTDPAAFTDNWAGFWSGSSRAILVIVTAGVAGSALMLASIARLFVKAGGR